MNIGRYSYEDTDKRISIELYGLVFEIKNINGDEIEEIKSNKEAKTLEQSIDKLLGDGAVQKINEKRVQDGHEAMDYQIEVSIIGFILETYSDALQNKFMSRFENSIDRFNNRVNDFGNRSTRRNNRRYNNRRY